MKYLKCDQCEQTFKTETEQHFLSLMETRTRPLALLMKHAVQILDVEKYGIKETKTQTYSPFEYMKD